MTGTSCAILYGTVRYLLPLVLTQKGRGYLVASFRLSLQGYKTARQGTRPRPGGAQKIWSSGVPSSRCVGDRGRVDAKWWRSGTLWWAEARDLSSTAGFHRIGSHKLSTTLKYAQLLHLHCCHHSPCPQTSVILVELIADAVRWKVPTVYQIRPADIANYQKPVQVLDGDGVKP